MAKNKKPPDKKSSKNKKPKRKGLSKKLRFEVFKRDSFTCQYCGQSSPEVILNVDHINPVAKGGNNSITNLITSCFDCNSGKGARGLDDNTIIEKQKAQLDELNERRLQLEMMLKWREGLQELNGVKAKAIIDLMETYSSFIPNESGKKDIIKWLKKYTLEEILDATEISFDRYLEFKEKKATLESWEKAFNYVPRIIYNRRKDANKPYMNDLFYIRGILNNTITYVDNRTAIELLEQAHLANVSIDELKQIAKDCYSWASFQSTMYDYIEKTRSKD